MGLMNSAPVRYARQSKWLRPVGVATYRAADRLMPAGDGPRVVVNSMPKAGTHLVTSLLDNLEGMRFSGRLVMYTEKQVVDGDLPRVSGELQKALRLLRPAHYFGAHMVWDAELESRIAASDAKALMVIRDPRAVVVSAMHYLEAATWMPWREELMRQWPDRASVLKALIHGHGEPGDQLYFPEIGHHYASYARWMDAPATCLVRFEDLVGTRGGGSEADQLAEVTRVLDHLGYGTQYGHAGEGAHDVARRMFSEHSVTFRSGRVDSWRDDLPEGLAAEIVERCAVDMSRLGYA